MELIECVKIPGVQSVYGLLELDQVLGMGEPLRMDAPRKTKKPRFLAVLQNGAGGGT